MPASCPPAIARWRKAWVFAARTHSTQLVPDGDANYLQHLGAVTLEILAAHLDQPLADLDLAVQCAMLHDTVEDQGVSYDTLVREFGSAVADGVQALSKQPGLPKDQAMADSLERIRQQPPAVWCVKLADRITNLHGVPGHWSADKIERYRGEARQILAALGSAHAGLALRLEQLIAAYPDTADTLA